MDLMLEGKVAVITGAGRHVGREIALTLAREGVQIGVNDFFKDRADRVAEEIRAMGKKALALKADVYNIEEVKAMAEKVMREWGKVDILVNNAGIAPPDAGFVRADVYTLLEMPWGDWNATIQTNLFGAIHCTKAVLPSMVERKQGKIINIMSDAGREGQSRLTGYAAAKAGLGGLTKALARELGRYRINVNAVSLGMTPSTDMSITSELYGVTPEEWEVQKQALMKRYPLGRSLNRLGTPQDAANFVCFLVSEKAQWITGQIMSINGGYFMGG